MTKYYDVSYTALEVLRLTLCISSGSATKVYDGTALICETYTLNTYASDGILMDGLRDGDTLTVVFKGSITKVGSMNNYFTIVVKDSSGNNVTKLYNFTSYWILGVLTVTE